MLLAIDVGNSQTVIGAFDQMTGDGGRVVGDRGVGDRGVGDRGVGDRGVGDCGVGDRAEVRDDGGTDGPARSWRLSTDARRTADELALWLDGLLGLDGVSLRRDVTGVAVASVVPAITERLRELTETLLGFPAVIVEPGTRTGVAVRTDNPREVGADRLVNALAAFEAYGGPSVVVDFGTATSFDVVSARCEFLGGAIAPGVQISMEALTARGAQLGAVGLARPRSAIGRSTVESLRSGAVYGFAGQVDRVVEAIAAELPRPPTVVATGGLAAQVVAECRTIHHHDPLLTLRGLRSVWVRNT